MQVFVKRAEAPDGLPAHSPELRLLRAVERYGRVRDGARLGARALGALSLLAVGAVHLQQYLWLYSAIPTIGTLFVLNFAGATAVGLGLLAPLERVSARLGGAAVALLALAGAGQAATSFVFLLVSERTPLFGFMEPGYDPPALMASRVAELVAVALLGLVAADRVARRIRAGRW
ncbi:MAG TPA: hypothetical protein VFB42_00090 [Gaiellaceae bacterium]|nr:hypothetical protein [Gaiellaceae bacterium]